MWTQERTIKLVELWHQTPILWDTKHKDYRNRDAKRQALEDLAVEFDMTSLDIEKKMTGLKNQFRREHNKFKSTGNPSSNYSVEWFGYRPLLFLLETFNARDNVEVLFAAKKDFSDLRKRSVCLDADIYLPSDSQLLEMKEEREDEQSQHDSSEEHTEDIQVFDSSKDNNEKSEETSPPPSKRKKNALSINPYRETLMCQIETTPPPIPSPQTILSTLVDNTIQISNDTFMNRIIADEPKTSGSHHPKSSSPLALPSTSSTTTGPPQPRDEFAVYGDYVANCLRKYRDQHSVLVAQNKINNILFDGAIGRFTIFAASLSQERDNSLAQILSQHQRGQNLAIHMSECSSTKRD